MACVSKKNNSEPQYGFKQVPESLEEITAEWLEKALRQGSSISQETTITKVDASRLTNEESGVADGGGFSGSILVKLTPQYG